MRRGMLLVAAAVALTGCMDSGPRTVPKEYRKAVRQAAKECPDVTPRLLAAQIDQESGFDPKAVSKAGAQGIAQFVPETWARWGQDLDGDGVADPYNPFEAIDAQARLMCYLIDEAQRSGIDDDPVDLALAAYNAGWSNVEKYQGIPPFRETRGYVQVIRDNQPRYRFKG